MSNKRIQTVDRVRTPEGVATLYDYAYTQLRYRGYHPPRGFDVEDMVQAGIEFVFANLHKFDPHGGLNIDAWCTQHIVWGFNRLLIEASWEKSRLNHGGTYLISGRNQSYFGTDDEGDTEEAGSDDAEYERVLDRLTHDHRVQDLQSRMEALDEREHEVMDRILSGQTSKEISQALHIRQNTMRNIRSSALEKMGFDPDALTHKVRPVSDEEKAEIVRRYAEDEMVSFRELGAEYGRSWKSIRNWCAEAGVEIRSKGARPGKSMPKSIAYSI